MRVRHVRLDAFGPLHDLDTGDEPLPGLVVVHGPNEAGKSALFHFLTSMLYGFYPASRDRNPYAPWPEGVDASGCVEIELSDGRVAEVDRRLLSAPAGSLVLDGRRSDLGNRTLPFVKHVPRDVFRQVFALTLADLARLEGESWRRVQERLVAGLGVGDIRSAPETAAAMEGEAGRLWRPNRRGNQLAREMDGRIREVSARRREAMEGDRRLREADRERARLRERLRRAREEREACRIYIDKYRALLPIRGQLARIAGLEEEVGPVEELEGIPPDAAERLKEGRDAAHRSGERAERVRADLDEARRRMEAYGEAERRLIEESGSVRPLVGRIHGLEPVRVRIGQIEEEVRDGERRASALAKELFEDGGADSRDPLDQLEALDDVSVTSVRSAMEALDRAREDVRVAEGALADAPVAGDASGETEPWPHPPAWPGVLLAGLGLAGAVAGWVATHPALLLAAAALLAAGAWLLGIAVASGRRATARMAGERARRRERLERARQGEAGARARLTDALAGVPLRPELLERPPGDLPARLEALRDLRRTLEDRVDVLADLEDQRSAVREALSELGYRLERTLPEEPVAAAHVLEESLREAERLQESAGAAEREAERLVERLTEVERERDEHVAAVEALEARIRALADGDLEAGLARATERLQARERAVQLRAELERSHHDLDEIRERIAAAEAAGEEWVVDEEALARKRAREDELDHTIEKLATEAQGLDRDILHLSGEISVDAVDSELDALKERRIAALRRRDRLHLLAALLREADRRFREEHQPDVLRQAGRHLDVITGGRYGRILVGDDPQGNAFHLRGPDYPHPIEVGTPVSTGTREQVYLALRLAVLDHLDRGGEALPLFMDEAFVNWDRDRRERMFELLGDVVERRQVFVFTCHDSMAESLESDGARRLHLPAARSG